MNDPDVRRLPLRDQPARDRIASDLDTNLLVEAGAGSGKTTELVRRMTALVASGEAEIEQVAAVTFTRKAAGELRERFQTRLEREIRGRHEGADGHDLIAERLRAALDDIDRAFIGTIHAFCARLLRERPLEVGLDPGFEELAVEERDAFRARFWESHLERLTREADPVLEELVRAGIRPGRLSKAFERLVENSDIDFPADEVEPPAAAELSTLRAELDALVDSAWELMPGVEPNNGWCPMQVKMRTLHYTRDVTGWSEPADLFEALALLCKPGPRGHSMTLNRWRNKDLAKGLRDRIDAFGVGDTPAGRVVERWYAHRYALVIRFARHAAEEFAAYRLRTARLDFQDLLVLTARLLRGHPDVRRHLGERYRRVLVDEFQDTDPLQAEILLLLGSEPEENGEGAGDVAAGADGGPGPGAGGDPPPIADWRRAQPRPGALFVVGDPKQGIYRFRRADIRLYGFVKERFRAFGDVVELTTNFRSRPCIGDLVNGLFRREGYLPEAATPEQAAFEPLETRPPVDPVPDEGVFTYEVHPAAARQAEIARDDAARLATWIRARVDSGERTPGDFMILTRLKGRLDAYARALEERGVPVQVTGAGVGAEAEIEELTTVLECMIDPGNPVKVVAVLVGWFWGLDYEQLVGHRLAGGSFDARRPGESGHPEVLEALRHLHGWWRAATRQPADVFVPGLVDELGLVPYAAAGHLGSLRAGALVYALDAVRAATLAGDSSLPGAVEAMRSALALSEAEAPLEPGRTDVVRVMNLHQAKGLEARVVVLADPSPARDPLPDLHTTRAEQGDAIGYLRVTEPGPYGSHRVLAAPAGWPEKQEAEEAFERAEAVRLAYVAVTRAKEELWVATYPGTNRASAWALLEPWLEEGAEARPLEPGESEGREELRLGPDEAAERVAAAAAALAEASEPSFAHVSVTELAKDPAAAVSAEPAAEGASADAPDAPAYRGRSWGSAVHGALAAAASRQADDEGFRATCRDLLVDNGRPLDDHGEPRELDELVDLVVRVLASEVWLRAAGAGRHLAEIPFAVPWAREEAEAPAEETGRPGDGGRRQLDLFGPLATVDAGEADGAGADPGSAFDGPVGGSSPEHRVLEGVIDLAFEEADGWVIVDYKTDVGGDPGFPARSVGYRRQVELYAEAWSRLTGDPVKERILFYTSQGRVESW